MLSGQLGAEQPIKLNAQDILKGSLMLEVRMFNMLMLNMISSAMLCIYFTQLLSPDLLVFLSSSPAAYPQFFFYKMFSQNHFFKNLFTKSFLWSLKISLSTSRNARRCKVAYIWISPDPAKVGPTLEGGGVVLNIIFV